MKHEAVKDLFIGMVERYFPGATVSWTSQNRTVIPSKPFIKLRPGNIRRSRYPVISIINGVPVDNYESKFPVNISLFTNGREVPDSEQRENTAAEDMALFLQYLDSEYISDQCFNEDFFIEVQPEVKDLSGAIYDANYQFRSEASVMIHYMTAAVGYTGSYGEETIKSAGKEQNIDLSQPFLQSPSGGNSQELAREIGCGYFTAVNLNKDRSEDNNE